MCLRVSSVKKMKFCFVISIKSLKKGVGSGVGSDTDPRIRTKMLRIPITAYHSISSKAVNREDKRSRR
jgi:hypothetical protein